MNVFCFGAGKAGGKVVEQLLRYERQCNPDFISGVATCDATVASLDALELIPEDTRALSGATEANGRDSDGGAEHGAAAAADRHRKLLESTDDTPITTSDAFVVCAGLGDGIGGPTAVVLTKRFSRVYDRPMYGVGISSTATTNQQHVSNTLRLLHQLASKTDHVFGFDTTAWVKNEDEPISNKIYDALNAELTCRLGTLLAAGEVTTADNIGASIADASETMNTLRGGGLATLGYSERPLPSRDASVVRRLKRLVGDSVKSVDQIGPFSQITTQTQGAVHGQLTLSCDIDSASHGLLVIAR